MPLKELLKARTSLFLPLVFDPSLAAVAARSSGSGLVSGRWAADAARNGTMNPARTAVQVDGRTTLPGSLHRTLSHHISRGHESSSAYG